MGVIFTKSHACVNKLSRFVYARRISIPGE